VIGNGTPHQARDLIDDLGYHGTLWVDSDMTAYRAAGLERGVAKALSPRMIVHAVRAMRAGHRQKSVQGDPWQMGGTFVIAPHDEVLYAHVSREAGDHPDLAAVMAVLRRSSA
jgi:hypothetical protein